MNTHYIEALNKFAAKVRSQYPRAKIRAFGSYARGTATEESDLDICVVLEKSGPEDRLAISDMAWDVGFDSGILVSTIGTIWGTPFTFLHLEGFPYLLI